LFGLPHECKYYCIQEKREIAKEAAEFSVSAPSAVVDSTSGAEQQHPNTHTGCAAPIEPQAQRKRQRRVARKSDKATEMGANSSPQEVLEVKRITFSDRIEVI
jgi:hypothetical protein